MIHRDDAYDSDRNRFILDMGCDRNMRQAVIRAFLGSKYPEYRKRLDMLLTSTIEAAMFLFYDTICELKPEFKYEHQELWMPKHIDDVGLYEEIKKHLNFKVETLE